MKLIKIASVIYYIPIISYVRLNKFSARIRKADGHGSVNNNFYNRMSRKSADFFLSKIIFFKSVLIEIVFWSILTALLSFTALKITADYANAKILTPQNNSVFVNQNSPYPLQNGSAQYPFKNISTAVDFVRENPDFNSIFIAPGTYREKIIAGRGIKLLGENKEVVISNPDENSGSTLRLQGDNLLYNISARKGRYAIYIEKSARTDIVNSEASQAKWYGIYSEINEDSGENADVRIIRSRVADNALQGLYLQKGFFLISRSVVENNGEEGIDLHFGINARIRNNEIRKNGESGIETEIDDNDLLIENNIIENNGKNGINLQTGMSKGKIAIFNNAIKGNLKYGIRCAFHAPVEFPFFKKVMTQNSNQMERNELADLDPGCNR